MPLSRTANLLLYVPFSREYTTPKDAPKISMGDFFEKCFVDSNLEEKIELLESLPENEVCDREYLFKREDFIKKYEEEIVRNKSFWDWIEGNGDGVYLFRGDAGTGKTTYLHYLKWKYKEINWKILDLRRATERINVIGYRIKFNNFYSLHGKIISSIIDRIISNIFVSKISPSGIKQYDYEKTYNILQIILSKYTIINQVLELPDEYGVLYRNLLAIELPKDDEKEKYCKSCANIIASYFMKNCALSEDLSDALEYAISHYMIILKCLESKNQKTIIAFDNIERFIGVHEIYSSELVKFIKNIRRITDSYKNDFFNPDENRNIFAENFQFIVAMRNTSARGFTPRQNADFFEGSIDLSEWFTIEKIINNKLEWYKTNGVDIENEERLKYILEDFGIAEGGIVRGLRPKLNLIFNYNKRLTIEFLVEMLESVSNRSVLASSDDVRLRSFKEPSNGLAPFAYRSIIWRLLMDKLNQGGMFQFIFSKKNAADDSQIALKYIRDILTILSNYSIENGEQYMPLEDIVGILHHMHGETTSWFDDWTWEVEREKIAQLLYYMNYYNRRENNWFQFIDLQCNDASFNKYHFEKWEDIYEMIRTKNKVNRKIGVRITNAGRAYIGYIAQTFEFVSCLEGYTKPLLCCLPSKDNLKNTEIDSLDCVQAINKVANSVDQYIKDDDKTIRLERTDHGVAYTYTDRLINSHIGYLDNFCRCIEKSIDLDDETISEKKMALIDKIRLIAETYRTKNA